MTRKDDKKHEHEHEHEQEQEQKQKQELSQKQRKERVLHTRIPAVLEHELKQLAVNLRVPVSNLVRTILQDAMEAAEAVGRAAEQELRSAADMLAQERARLTKGAAAQGTEIAARLVAHQFVDRRAAQTTEKTTASTEKHDSPETASPLDGVLGFQEFVLAIESRCAVCERPLAVGEPAYLGVRDAPGPRIIIGPECLPGNKENTP